MKEKFYGAIEAGGTKFNCMVAAGMDDIRAETRIATKTPAETIPEAIAFFRAFEARAGQRIAAFGIASFGPVDLKETSPTYGFITDTPKPYWPNTDLAGEFRRAFAVPVGFDTDVNGAGLGEYTWGAGRGCRVFVYITVGTGIGGGVLIDGVPLHGLVHTEMGHIPLPHDLELDPYPGGCPFHGDCLQGLASGRAMHERWHRNPVDLPADHPGWDLEAEYLAAAVCTFSYTLSPERIIMGGGVMDQAHLLPRIREKALQKINGYIRSPVVLEQMGQYLVTPELGSRAGVWGAIQLACNAAESAS